MKILVTGVTGFIGGRIAGYLLDNGFIVRGNGRSKVFQSSISAKIQYVEGSLNSPVLCSRLTKDIDIVVHCAGKAGTWGDYDSFYKANVIATQNLLKAAKENNVKRFINISSPSIYFTFKDQLNVKESFLPKRFSNSYAKTKYLAEKEVQRYHSSVFQTVSLRPRLVIGAGDNNVLPRLIRLKEEGRLTQVGDGKNMVTVTSIGNLFHAIDLCIKAPASAMGTSYNIGNESPESFWNFVNEVFYQFGLEKVTSKISYRPVFVLAKINQFILQFFRIKREPALLPVTVSVLAKSMTLDLDHAKKQLGYRPTYSTKGAIEEFTRWREEGVVHENI